jgi:hypothetical protein
MPFSSQVPVQGIASMQRNQSHLRASLTTKQAASSKHGTVRQLLTLT